MRNFKSFGTIHKLYLFERELYLKWKEYYILEQTFIGRKMSVILKDIDQLSCMGGTKITNSISIDKTNEGSKFWNNIQFELDNK